MVMDAALGQYYPTESFLHKMDPRTKLLLSIVYIVCIFFALSYTAFLALTVFLALAIAFSRVPVKSVFRSIKPIVYLIVFTAIINLFFSHKEGAYLFYVAKYLSVSYSALAFTLIMVLRLLYLVLGTSLLTLTTTPVALTDAIEWLLSPLRVVRFPVHELALIMSIALRFIPTLMDETDRIMKAQKARGANFESGSLIARAKALLPILIPLLVSAFRRADELSDAMDSRCYGGPVKRTKYKKYSFGIADVIGSAALLIFCGYVIFDFIAPFEFLLAFRI